MIILISFFLCKDILDIFCSWLCNRIFCIFWCYRIIYLGYFFECFEICGENGVWFYYYVCEREFVNGFIVEVNMENCVDIVFLNIIYFCNRVFCGWEWVIDNWSWVCEDFLFFIF